MSKKAQILKLLKAGKSVEATAKAVKVKPAYVYYIRWMDQNKGKAKKYKASAKTKKPSKIIKAVQEMNADIQKIVRPVLTQKEADALMTPVKLIETREFLSNLISKETEEFKTPDPVNHPPHYKAGGIETIDFIEAKDLNYRLGNVIKYVSRAGKKNSDPLVDLKKARWYLDREIFAREGA